MADDTPPPLETKDLPHTPVSAPVPYTDRIGYEAESDEDTASPATEAPTAETSGKGRRAAKSAADKE